MTTCKGNHNLLDIYCDGPEMEQSVVRWCEECGAIVVDVVVDGRTAPGRVMAMRLPKTESIKQGE